MKLKPQLKTLNPSRILSSTLRILIVFAFQFSIDNFQLLIPVVFAQTGATVPLEAPIGDISAIVGTGGGYVVNYTRILFAFVAGLAGILAMLMLIVAGIQIIIGGSEEKNTQAKSRIIGALGGLVLLATSGWILYAINPCFFSFEDTQTCTRRIIAETTFRTVSGPGTVSAPVAGTINAPPAPRGGWIAPIYRNATVSESDKTRIQNAFMYNPSSQFLPLPDPLPTNPIEAIMAVINSQLRVVGTFHPNFTTCNPMSSEFMRTYCGAFCNLYVTWIFKHASLPYDRSPGNVSDVRAFVLGIGPSGDELTNSYFWYIPIAPDQRGRPENGVGNIRRHAEITPAEVAAAPRPPYSPDRPQAGDIVFFNCPARTSVEGSSDIAGQDCHIAIVTEVNGDNFKYVDNAQFHQQEHRGIHARSGPFEVMGFGRLRSAPQTTASYTSMFTSKRIRLRPRTAATFASNLGVSDTATIAKIQEWETVLRRGNRRNPIAPDTPENFFAGTAIANRLNELFFEQGTSPGTPPS